VSGLGPSFIKIWTWRKLSAKWVSKCLKADQKRQRWQSSEQLLELFRPARSKWFPVAIGDHGRNLVISLWPGDKATINGVAALRLTPLQIIPSAKIRWKISRLDYLGSRRHLPHWLSSKGPNYQREVLLISAGAIKWRFEGKTLWEGHQGGLDFAWQCPGSPGTCNPEETGLPGISLCWSPILFSGLAPSDYHLFPGLKKNWKLAIFLPTRRSLLPRRPGWTHNLLNFFFLSGL